MKNKLITIGLFIRCMLSFDNTEKAMIKERFTGYCPTARKHAYERGCKVSIWLALQPPSVQIKF